MPYLTRGSLRVIGARSARICTVFGERRTKPFCVRERFAGASKGRLRCGRSVGVGFGSDCSEVPVFRVQPAALDLRVVPGCPPEPTLLAVLEVDLKLAPHRVADATLEGAQRLLLGLALGKFSVVVDASRCVVRDLCDCDEVHRMVELSVPARVEPMPFARSAGCLDGRGAVVGREPFLGREAGGVADVSEDQSGDDRGRPPCSSTRLVCDAATASVMRVLIAPSSRSRRRMSKRRSRARAVRSRATTPAGCAPRSSRAARSALNRKGALPATSSRISA